MKKSSFKPYSLGSSNRKTYQINQFLGVDYSTQKFRILTRFRICFEFFIKKKRNTVVKSFNFRVFPI